MAEYPTYSTGTVSISNGNTSVVGSGTGWTDTDARAGDLIQIGTAQPVEIRDRTDATHLTLWAAWSGGAVSGGVYKVIKKAPSRFNATATMIEVSETFRAMNTDGYYFYVSSTETVPNPSYGNDGQFAMQATTGKLWVKEGGVWVFVGINKGFGLPAAWSSVKAYVAYDVVSVGGSTYVCIVGNTNHSPPNTTYWTLLASIGNTPTIAVGTVATGAGGAAANVWNTGTAEAAVFNFSIPQGKQYSTTSTSAVITGLGVKTFVVDAGLAVLTGARYRATNSTNWMEGQVIDYSGSSLTILVDKVFGSGTFSTWNLTLTGEPGSGDLSSINALSELIGVAAAARGNLGLSHRIMTPQGRLTLSPATPVMGTSYTGINAVYYTPCVGDVVPIYDGTDMVPTVFAELGITMGSTDWGANTNYDVFVVNDAGTIRLVTGPAWATASTRGTGTGTTELERFKGLVFNKQAISARYSPSGTMSVAARRGTYAGTIHTAGAGSVNYIFGAVGTGGVAADFGVWNMYNRVPVTTFIGDTTNSWNNNTAANVWRVANDQTTTMRVSAVRGMDEDPVRANYYAVGVAGTGAVLATGIGVNNTASFSGSTTTNNFTTNAISVPAAYSGLMGLGYTYVVPLEYNNSTNDGIWLGDGGLAYLQTGMHVELWA